MFSFLLFFIVFFTLLIKDLYYLIKFNKRIDYIPSILLGLFIVLLVYGVSNVDKPFLWKKEFYKGKNIYYGTDDKIYLYKDGTCVFEIKEIENNNIICGKFKVIKDTLTFSEFDSVLVNKSFGTQYFFGKDSSLISLDDKYMQIVKINNN